MFSPLKYFPPGQDHQSDCTPVNYLQNSDWSILGLYNIWNVQFYDWLKHWLGMLRRTLLRTKWKWKSFFLMIMDIFINELVYNQLYILNGKLINKTITSSHCCLSSCSPLYNCLSHTSQLFLICVHTSIFQGFPGSSSTFHMICLRKIKWEKILTVNICAVLSIRCSV